RLLTCQLESIGTDRWTTTGSVLITGGLGALGLHLARRLAERGVAHLVLTGRGGIESPGGTEAVSQLESLGCRVTVAAADAADATAMEALLHAVDREGPALAAVFHLAGIEDRTPLAALTNARLEEVLRPKV